MCRQNDMLPLDQADDMPSSDQANSEPMPLFLSHDSRRTLSVQLAQERGRTLEASASPIVKLELSRYWVSGSCKGLLYFAEWKDEGRVILSNPLRQEYLKLPPLPSNIQFPLLKFAKTYGLGCDGTANSFKMVCVFFRERDYEKQSYSLGTVLHDLGTASWKEISEVPPYPIKGTPVFSHGFLHWIVDPCFAEENSKGMVVAFDVSMEKFVCLAPPSDLCSKDYDFYQLVDLNGDLGIVDPSSDEKMDIWVMRDYGKKEWIKEYTINICAPEVRPKNWRAEVRGVWKNGDILLECNCGFFLYNQKTGLSLLPEPYNLVRVGFGSSSSTFFSLISESSNANQVSRSSY
ncbi:hypothetical protein RJ639_020294 [Escallonia herrerae]|uniref:F-box associated beta-propeller type 3 domain-containing protein n=1 Tax=Escallonia herrerae TaxID=1293975 RepID=A0AA89AH67_9ASTE|nr:hypothetical protein RJ639_020294 [Escallonia herrerae]